MVADDGHDRVGEVDGREDVGPDARVLLHLVELGVRQLAGLVEDVLGNRELSQVVQQRGGLDGLQFAFVPDADHLGEADGVRLHAPDVPVRHLVLGVDRHGQRLDGREVEGVEVFEVAVGVFDALERRLEREVADHQQGKHDGDRRQVELALVLDQQERGHRRGAEVVEQHPSEVLAPDAPDLDAAMQRDDGRGEPAVEQEVRHHEDGDGDQVDADARPMDAHRPAGRCAIGHGRQRQRQGRHRRVEGDLDGLAMSTPEAHDQAIDGDDDGGRRRAVEQGAEEDECLGDRDGARDVRDADAEGARERGQAEQGEPPGTHGHTDELHQRPDNGRAASDTDSQSEATRGRGHR
jgi:hypothetical protein